MIIGSIVRIVSQSRRGRRLRPDTAFSELVEAWLHNLRRSATATATLVAYRRDLLGVARRMVPAGEVGLPRLAEITKDALRAGFASWATDHAVVSVRRAHSSWSGFFNFLVAEDVCEGNPMAAVAKPSKPVERPRAIQDPDAATRLLAAAAQPDPSARDPWPERDLALVATFCVTGIRAAEAVALSTTSLGGPDGDRHLVVVGRAGKVRSIPIDQALEIVLGACVETRVARFDSDDLASPATPLFVDVRGRRLTVDQVKYLIERLYVRAGLRDQVPAGALVHALRHTFAVSAVEAGIDVVGLQALLGHASPETTRRYVDATAEDVGRLIDDHRGRQALRRHVEAQAPTRSTEPTAPGGRAGAAAADQAPVRKRRVPRRG